MSVLNIFCFLFVVGTISTAYGENKICAGCPKKQDVNDPEIRNHLTNAVTSWNAETNDEPINIVSVTEAYSQIVAGVKYRIVFNGEGKKTKKPCKGQAEILLQPWISPKPQLLEFKCPPIKSKRDLVGEAKNVSPEELEQVKVLVQEGMETLDELDADDNKRVVVRVVEAKKKLVNGIMYDVTVEVKITSCPEQGLTNNECFSQEVSPRKVCELQLYRSFADKSPHNAKVVKSECATPESRSVSGGEHISSLSRKAANFAAKMINNRLNSITVKGVVNVLETNHVNKSGLHHISLTIELGDTNCTKQHENKDSDCIVLPTDEGHLFCTVDVDYDEKTDKFHLHSNGFNCKNVHHHKTLTNRARRSLVGGDRPLELSSEHLDDLKQFVSSHLTQVSDSAYKKTIVNVLSSSYQIVSGRMVKLLVEVANTNCLKTEENKGDCSLSEQGRLVCNMHIWEKPWLNQKEVIKNECNSIEPVPELLGVEESDENLQKFRSFTSRFDRSYPTVQELRKRFRIFRANMKKADYLQKTDQGSATYGASIFADLSSSEFKKRHLGLKKRSSSDPVFKQKQAEIPDINLPDEYDWRNFNVVTPVKNQGMCGSCWAFSITGNIEGQYAIKTGNLISLSEQELVDCDKYDSGCEGGLFDTAYHAVEEIGGLEGESDYPYTGRDDKCHFNTSEVRVSISSSVNISHNETDMAKWLVGNGPISIALNANAMQLYLGGVSHPWKVLCSPDDLDHGVLIVGYGIHKYPVFKKSLPFWLIKNSWGESWGLQGYYMLYRGDGTCGVNQMPSSAIL